MLDVISSYMELTGFQPVEFLAEPSGKAERTDKCCTAE